MRVEPFEAAHALGLTLQPHQEAWGRLAGSSGWESIAASGQAWTALSRDRVLACCGVVDKTGGRAEAWALISADIGSEMLTLTRAIRRGFKMLPYRRIEINTASTFPPAARWAQMLGFTHEGTARAYCEDGSDGERWARIR